MRNKIVVFGGMLVVAGIFVWTRPHSLPPADLRDAVAEKSAAAQLGAADQAAVPDARPVPANKGYVAMLDASVVPVEFVTIRGGRFMMGTDSFEKDFEHSKPMHEVNIRTFDISRTEITVAQYAECVGKGACTEPERGGECNWGISGRGKHPVNCLTWEQTRAYAKFMGGRLPTEAEWEYAATSGGRNQKYPWGNEVPDCAKAVRYWNPAGSCEGYGTMPVCSKPAGNTSQGLCDMAGNVWEWVQDVYRDSYTGAPADGRAVEGPSVYKVIRGGSYTNRNIRSDYRAVGVLPGADLGFRIVRLRR